MPFQLNDKNINRGGRPKGSFSYSVKLRNQITDFCEENLEYFLNEIKSMKNGHAKSQAFLALLNFALPKLTENNSQIDLNNLTDNDIEKLFNKVLNDETTK